MPPIVFQELFDDYLKSSGFPLSLLCFDSFWLLPDRIFRGRDKPGNRICSFFGISHENVQVLEKETRLCIFWSTIFDWSQSESKKIKQFLHTFMSSASARTTVNQPDSCCPSGIMDILPYNYCEMAFGYPLFAKKEHPTWRIFAKRECR